MKLHFVSFIGLAPGAEKQAKYLGDETLLNARQIALSDSALQYGDVNHVHFWNRKRLLDTPYYQQNKALLDQPRGCGYWAWKPYIILQTLAQAEKGDYVIYCDVGKPTENAQVDHGNVITTSLLPLVEWAERNGGLLPGVYLNNHGPAKNWIKRDCFRLTGCDEPRYYGMPTVQAGYTVWKNTPKVIEFLEKWQTLNLDPRLITDQENTLGFDNLNGFIRHCHDQATLSLLCEKEGVRVFGDRKYQFWGFRNINYIALEASYQNAVKEKTLNLMHINSSTKLVPNYLVRWIELLVLKQQKNNFNVAIVGDVTEAEKAKWQQYCPHAKFHYFMSLETISIQSNAYDLLIAISLPDTVFDEQLLVCSYRALTDDGTLVLGPMPSFKSSFEQSARAVSSGGDFVDSAVFDEFRKTDHSPKIPNSRNPIFVSGKSPRNGAIETLCIMIKPSPILGQKTIIKKVANDS